MEKRLWATFQIKGPTHLLLSVTSFFPQTQSSCTPPFLQFVCFCCQKSEYSLQAIPPRSKHRVDTNQPPWCSSGLLQAILQPSDQSSLFGIVLYCPGMPPNKHRASSGATKGKVEGQSLSQMAELHGSFPVPSCSSSGCPFSHTNPQAH